MDAQHISPNVTSIRIFGTWYLVTHIQSNIRVRSRYNTRVHTHCIILNGTNVGAYIIDQSIVYLVLLFD